MDKITWCLHQKNGMELIDPNDNLREAYLLKAEESLNELRRVQSRDWQFSTAYYTIYNSLYSLLMKIGIKCKNIILVLKEIEMIRQEISKLKIRGG